MNSDSVFSGPDEQLPPPAGLPNWLWLIPAVLIAGIVLVIALAQLPSEPVEVPLFAGTEARPVAISTDGYVGSAACRDCHGHEYDTWHDSFHRTMTQVASPEAIVGDFDNVELDLQGRPYRLGRQGDQFYAEFALTSQQGQPAKWTRRNIVLSTGSHHMQVYWLSTGRGRELAVLPFVWLIDEQKWIPRDSAFLKAPTHSDGFETGRWNRSCITCHTTHGQRNLDPPDAPQSSVSEFGIACEACHGPGQDHVRYHSGTDPQTGLDPIANPRKLSHERASEVCGQCHMAWHAEVADAASAYRPGDELLPLRRVDPKPSQFWADGMVRVVGREFNGLLDSPCYQQGELSCLSCHTMHQASDDPRDRHLWTDDQLKPGMRTDQACLQCHGEFEDEQLLTAHTHHPASSSGSRCYNCHMPNTTYGLLKATHSHQISNPSAEETRSVGRPNACNLCHLDKSLGWTSQHLAEWFGQPELQSRGAWSDTSLAVQLAVAGDASQRALMAWHMGWESAQTAAGTDWLAPYLALLMVDPYPAVRFMAHRALQTLGGYGDISYDSEMSPAELQHAGGQVVQRWEASYDAADRPELLIFDGQIERGRLSQLMGQRDQTEIWLDE